MTEIDSDVTVKCAYKRRNLAGTQTDTTLPSPYHDHAAADDTDRRRHWCA